ncbi:MAG: nitrous oxide reductase family maturation protein NosD, partial [Deltaproteobacteria bacterium]
MADELRIAPGADLAGALAEAPAGAVVTLAPGRYPARLTLERDVVQRAAG